jgi:hypothetical protein
MTKSTTGSDIRFANPYYITKNGLRTAPLLSTMAPRGSSPELLPNDRRRDIPETVKAHALTSTYREYWGSTEIHELTRI